MATSSKRELKALCEQFIEKYRCSPQDFATGLEYFALHVFAQEDGFADSVLGDAATEAVDLAQFHTGGPRDLGIDGLLYDQDLLRVNIIQTKYVAQGTIGAEDLGEAREFFSRLSEWESPKKVRARGSVAVQEVVDGANLDSKTQAVALVFVTTRSTTAGPLMLALAEEKTREYAERGRNVECRVYGTTDLLKHFASLRNALGSAPIPTVRLHIPAGSAFEFEGSRRVLVAAVKGNEIASLYNRIGVNILLFNSNIRLALQTGKINPKIVDTIESKDAENFFYFNNGITATCSSYELAPFGELTVEKMQVVNGAQTVNAIKDTLFKTPNDDVYVLLRLIETGTHGKAMYEFADKVTRFQNTQNTIKESDFYANEDLQKYLVGVLAEKLSGRGACVPFWYCNKRGYEPRTHSGAKVTLEQLGLLRHAILNGPTLSYATAGALWDGTGGDTEYWAAFGSGDGEKCLAWTAEEIFQVGWAITVLLKLRGEHRALMKRKRDGEGTFEETGHLSYLARYITALTF